MYCHNCGSEIDDNDAAFCSKCGTKIKKIEKEILSSTLDVKNEESRKDESYIELDTANQNNTSIKKENPDSWVFIKICAYIICAVVISSLFIGLYNIGSDFYGGEGAFVQGEGGEGFVASNSDITHSLTQEQKNTQICEEIVQNYYETHTYVSDDVFDCDNMAMDVWNLVESKGINAEIAVGNVDMKDANLEDINHAWVIAEVSPQNWVAIECTSGYLTYDDVYYSGWFFDNPKNYQSFLNVYTTWEYKYQEYENYRLYYNELVEQFNEADAYEQASLRSGLEIARENLHQKERDFLQAKTELNALLEYG
ncbi:zinc ribbon domain-containing protein [Methanohalophilus halophilus]|uniref:Zinc-ribbon domain-containing protein n=1 Tax=Methanohalophilus halophilus TaxID=2177 RepID=A0A1L3Q031_9EURY|nr:zinc ribbon domain-containing protein [Methanohalophilus halophilus]APH38230.1 hypothetical protein BHR79_01175 [Methanohalophilus halophilus]RNI10903.1 zinc-ribbon domain-containing protein [Methanohalophilus halophilus]SDV99864.1 zinc-ribbon domain-containing protein [Methanohalophilus halophilus]